MREAPDVLMIGEIRDQETMQAAIAYAETGHLCLATLHANNTYQALDRIVNFFPDTAHHQLLVDLSLNLKAVVSQRLLHGAEGGRLPAVEILLGSPFVAELIEKGEIAGVRDAMKQSFDLGMLTFDESIYRLYATGRINYDEALANADSRTDLSLRIRLEGPQPPGGQPNELEFAQVQDIAQDGRTVSDPASAEERELSLRSGGMTGGGSHRLIVPASPPVFRGAGLTRPRRGDVLDAHPVGRRPASTPRSARTGARAFRRKRAARRQSPAAPVDAFPAA